MSPKTNAASQEDHGQTLLSWRFAEYTRHKRSRRWYTLATIIGGVILVFSLLAANFLFAVIIIMVAIIIFFHATREPVEVTFKITEDGLEVGSRFYPYEDIKNFWLLYNPPEVKNLYFNFKGFLRPDLAIPLEEQNPLKVRQLLLEYLEEDLSKENEPFSDGLGRILKI